MRHDAVTALHFSHDVIGDFTFVESSPTFIPNLNQGIGQLFLDEQVASSPFAIGFNQGCSVRVIFFKGFPAAIHFTSLALGDRKTFLCQLDGWFKEGFPVHFTITRMGLNHAVYRSRYPSRKVAAAA